jgi:hypothetical protein
MELNIKKYTQSYINRKKLNNDIILASHFAIHIIKYYYTNKESIASTMGKLLNAKEKEEDIVIKAAIDYTLHFFLLYGIKRIQKKYEIETYEEHNERKENLKKNIIDKWYFFCSFLNNNKDPDSVIEIFNY